MLRSLQAFFLAVTIAGCHATTRAPVGGVRLKPDATDEGEAAGAAVAQLRRDIDATLADPALSRGFWGVLIKSLATDETLYSLNAGKLMMPASNMKIVTLAAAAEKLGWDYAYETTVRAAGRIDDGVLIGDLVVVGSGDPSLMASDGSADRVFARWAEQLQAAGVRAIAGRIVGDDNAFDDETLGFGWSWDDLPDDYAAGVGALQLNEDAVRITITSGADAGDSAGVSVATPASGLSIDNNVTTSAAGGSASISVRRLPGSSRLTLRGSIPAGSAPIVTSFAVDNPTLFFVNALRSALIANGIDVRGPAVDIDDLPDAPSSTQMRTLVTYRSPALSALAERLMKASQNQYAETLLKTIGSSAGGATAANGRAAVESTLGAWGVAPNDLIQRDGSGLSRYDYVTPEALVTILTHVDRDPRLSGPFAASLPLAGRDGTLSNRMNGTVAANNARAKTGSMSNVRALSGFVTTADGERVVFSIIANNFDAPAETINRTTDAIVSRVAALRRKD
jgi:D-alanyl-D-alanine carboxypeptidase/D-alanyl-D-alanine-endopeptidase (penicillin-binding protein 4)